MHPTLRLPLLGLVALATSLGTAHAQAVRTGTVAQRYKELCSNCHGDKLQGAQARSLLDDNWLHGGDDASIEKSILNLFDIYITQGERTRRRLYKDILKSTSN